MKLYGIPNCDTVKKARVWLERKGIDVEFVDFKKTKPSSSEILLWKKAFGDLPVNTKGQTYKKHKDEYEGLSEKEKITFLIEHSSMIKRPILQKDSEVIAFGFDEKLYQQKLAPLK